LDMEVVPAVVFKCEAQNPRILQTPGISQQ
jgi:hypothetical protein